MVFAIMVGYPQKEGSSAAMGVVIDEDLECKPHVTCSTPNSKNKISFSLNMIKRIIKFIPKSEYMKIYDALFNKSHLSYCISSWVPSPLQNYKVYFLYRKGVSGYFLGLNTASATLGTMKPVLEAENLRKTSALNILNNYLTKMFNVYIHVYIHVL